MDFTARRERTLYYTSPFAAAVLNLNALGAMFNLPDSPNAFLVWAVFGIALAYAYRLRLLLAAGLVSVVSFIGMSIMRWSGAGWAYVGLRTEAFLAGAALVVARRGGQPGRLIEKFHGAPCERRTRRRGRSSQKRRLGHRQTSQPL
jgi:hypothetical protein